MTYLDYLKGLSDSELAAYASEAGVSIETIRQKYMRTNNREVPRLGRMIRLTQASHGKVSRQAVLDHFYPPVLWEQAA